MKRVYLYYLFGVLGAFGGPINDGDPAPGRSPGPPLEQSYSNGQHLKKVMNNLTNVDEMEKSNESSLVAKKKRNAADYENLFCGDLVGREKKVKEYLRTSDVLMKLEHTVLGPENHKMEADVRPDHNIMTPPSTSLPPHSSATLTTTATTPDGGTADKHKFPLLFDVTHDVFDSRHGLLPGVAYRGE